MNTITTELAGLEGGSVAPSSADLDGLSAPVEGPLLREGDDDWDDSVVVWNGMVARCPALHQRTSAHDVVAAVGFALGHGVLLGIKVVATTSPAPPSPRSPSAEDPPLELPTTARRGVAPDH